MLSDNLNSLLETLQRYETDGVLLKPVAVRRICADLAALHKDALSMEATGAMPLINSCDENVVNLINERARRTLIEHGRKCGAEFIIRPNNEPDGAA